MSFPSLPDEIQPDVYLGLLAHHCAQHHLALVHDSLPLADAEVIAHALAALAYGTVVTRHIESGRWSTAVDALTAGAGLEHTAAAMDLDVRGLRIGLGQWITERGSIDADRYDQVVSLIREESAR